MPEPVKKKLKVCQDITDLSSIVFDYMKKQNRPYSLINVFDNLRGAHPKPQLQLALDHLCDDGQGYLIVKSYGSQKAYFCRQDIFGDCTRDAVYSVELEVETLKRELADINQQTNILTARSPVSDAVLLSKRDALLAELAVVNHQVEKLTDLTSQSKGLLAEFEVEAKRFATIQCEMDRRKRIFLHMLDSLCESLNMTRTDMAQELGCELTV